MQLIGQPLKTPNSTGERIRLARLEKGWMIRTLAAKAGITPEGLSNIERQVSNIENTTLRRICIALGQPIQLIGGFENMPEDTFFQRLEKARCYHGHTKVEMAKVIGVNIRVIFDWKVKEPNQVVQKKIAFYLEII